MGENPLTDFTRDDSASTKHMQDRFKIIQQHSTDPRIRELASKVLSGASSPREALRDPAFAEFLASSVQKGMDKIKSLSKEEREQLIEQGEKEYLFSEGDPHTKQTEEDPGDLWNEDTSWLQ